MAGVRLVLAEDATWTFPGRNRFSGTDRGVEGVTAAVRREPSQVANEGAAIRSAIRTNTHRRMRCLPEARGAGIGPRNTV